MLGASVTSVNMLIKPRASRTRNGIACLVAATFFLNSTGSFGNAYPEVDTTSKSVPTGDPSDVVYNGSFSQRVSFKLPEQRGLEPRLGLSYNSSRSTSYGPGELAGAGWRLTGLSTIQRTNFRKAVPKFDGSDIWLLDGEELVSCDSYVGAGCGAGATHATWVENYQRVKQISADNTWEVTSRDGTRYIYKPIGTWAGSETIPVSGDASTDMLTQYRYLLSEKINTKGQQVTYTYDCGNDLDCRISTISYGIGDVSFHWETRPDVVTYAAGHMLGKSAHRLRSVEVRAASQMLRTYELLYSSSPVTGRSLLASVTERGRDSTVAADGSVTSGTALPPYVFEYTGATPAPNRVADGQSFEFGPVSIPQFRKMALGSVANNRQIYSLVVRGVEEKKWVSHLGGYQYSYFCVLEVGGGEVSRWPSDHDRGIANNNYCAIRSEKFFFLKNSHSLAQGYFFNYEQESCHNGQNLVCNWTPHVNPTYGDPDVVGDVNGDGLDDTFDIGNMTVISGGGGWQNIRPQGFAAVDMNGDGLADSYHRDSTTVTVQYSNGKTGFDSAAISMQLPSLYHTYVVHGDFNGDGTRDFLRAINNSGTYKIAYMVGNTLVDGPEVVLPGSCVNGDSCSSPSVGDVNGDGRADLMVAGWYSTAKNPSRRDGKVFLNTESGFTLVERSAGSPYTFNGAIGGAGDGDQDGLPELSLDVDDQVPGVGSQRWTIIQEKPDLLQLVKAPLGAETKVTYSFHEPVDQVDMPLSLFVVTSIETYDGRSVRSTTDYAYEGAKWHWLERRFLGFEKITATLPQNPGETGRPIVETTYMQDFASVGKVKEVQRKNGSGTLLQKRVETYDVQTGTLPYWSRNTETVVTDYLDGTSREKRQERIFNDYGLVETLINHGDTSKVDGEWIHTRVAYPNTDKYIVDRWAVETINAGTVYDDEIHRKSRLWHYFDGANSANSQPPSEGFKTQSSQWTGGTAAESVAQVVSTYDSFGNMASEADALGNTSTYHYDTEYNLFPLEIRNPLYATDSRQKTQLSWDKVCGVVLTETDENGVVTTHSYDDLCRKTQTDLPGGGRISFDYSNWGDPTASFNRTSTLHPNGAGEIVQDIYFDGLGRTYLEEVSG